MLHLTQALPPGALIGAEAEALAATLPATNAIWFRAAEASVLLESGKITGWQDSTATRRAVPTEQNTGNSRFDPATPAAFLCQTTTHCGFVLDAPLRDGRCFSAAVIYTSPKGEARTLLSLSTGQTNNLIFLSESEGHLVAKDRDSTVVVSLPVPPGHHPPRLAIISFTGRDLSLSFQGNTVTATGRVPAMDTPAEVFIGCRSNRPGLTKTLGQSRLHDVLIWPDRAVLAPNEPADLAALAALHRYHRWVY